MTSAGERERIDLRPNSSFPIPVGVTRGRSGYIAQVIVIIRQGLL
jgi:hypothetical protein